MNSNRVLRMEGEDEKEEKSVSFVSDLNQEEIQQLRSFGNNALSAKSKKAYDSDSKNFLTFINKRFPSVVDHKTDCSLEHVLSFLNHLNNEKKKLSTIERHYSTVKKYILPHLFVAGEPNSRQALAIQQVNQIMTGMKKSLAEDNRLRGKRPLSLESVRKMVDEAKKLNSNDLNTDERKPNTSARDCALLLFMFHSALRRSEVSNLIWENLKFDSRGVTINIVQSKTDQLGKGQVIGIPYLENSVFCPVQALENWKRVSKMDGKVPVFLWISPSDEIAHRVLTDQRIVDLVKKYTAAIGLDSALYSGHSSRSGYITHATDLGVPISQVLLRSRHKSLSSVQAYMKSTELFTNSPDHKF